MLDLHPHVKVCVDHIAASLHKGQPPSAVEKLLALERNPNVWVKVSELAGSGDSYPYRATYPNLKRVYEAFGPDRLLWGTGYPGSCRAAYRRPSLADELTLIQREIPFLSEEERAKILGLNAAKIWKLG